MARNLYLIRRGRQERPANLNPELLYHPVIVCDSGKVARRQAGDTSDGATVWQYIYPDLNGSGWLIIRYLGFDIDYGHLVTGFDMPDDMHGGFYHPHVLVPPPVNPWDLLSGAVWWSSRPLPPGLAKAGVVLSPDTLTDPNRSTARAIADDEQFCRDKTNGVVSLGYRTTLDLDLSAARAADERGRVYQPALPGMVDG